MLSAESAVLTSLAVCRICKKAGFGEKYSAWAVIAIAVAALNVTIV
jgi:hypothetical protein